MTDPTMEFFWIAINLNFLASLVVISLVIIIFTYTRIIKHAMEIGLSRALGMDFKQVFILIFTEPLIIFILSAILGGCIAIFLLVLLVEILSPVMAPFPPFILNYNFPLLLTIYLITFGMTIIAGTMSSLLATRANVSKILKTE